jgi:hypothetical protein
MTAAVFAAADTGHWPGVTKLWWFVLDGANHQRSTSNNVWRCWQ